MDVDDARVEQMCDGIPVYAEEVRIFPMLIASISLTADFIIQGANSQAGPVEWQEALPTPPINVCPVESMC